MKITNYQTCNCNVYLSMLLRCNWVPTIHRHKNTKTAHKRLTKTHQQHINNTQINTQTQPTYNTQKMANMTAPKRLSQRFRMSWDPRQKKTASQIEAGRIAEDAIDIAACVLSEKKEKKKKRWSVGTMCLPLRYGKHSTVISIFQYP